MTIESEIQKKSPELNPLEDAVSDFVNSPKIRGFSLNSAIRYSSSLRALQKRCAEKNISDPSKITEDFLDEWTAELGPVSRKKWVHSPISCARAFKNWYDEREYAKTDPNSDRILSREQEITLITSIETPKDAAMIVIALNTGASLQEILALEKDDITKNEDQGVTILFNPTRNVRESRFWDAEIQNPIIASFLRKYIASLPKSQSKLFSHRGKVLKIEQAGKIIAECGKAIGVEDLSFKALENTFNYNQNLKRQ